MSEELANPSVSIKKRQRGSRKKNSNETSENRDESTPQCSKKTFEITEEKKKSRTKSKSSEKCQQKNIKNIKKLKIPDKDSEELNSLTDMMKQAAIEIMSTKQLCVLHQKEKSIVCDSVAQEILEQIGEQKKQKTPKKEKKKNKSKEKDKQESKHENTEVIMEVTQKKNNKCTSKIGSNAKPENIINAKKTLKSLKERETFPEYMPIEEIEQVLKNQSSTDRQYTEGYLRINPRFYKHAYLSMSDEQSDLLIIGLRDRNRAFEGDLVVARVNPPEKWQTLSGERKQKTGVIVHILEKIHPRRTIGYLKQHDTYALLHPRDQRVPLLRVYPESLPKQFISQPSLYEDTLFLANIVNWKKPQFAVGKIIEIVGSTGELEAESHAILLEHDLDVRPYSDELLEGLPDSDYVPTEDDMKDREDWRHECVFTIDPATAVDLDDAVSCKPLGNGNYEIGVHISDVTHYLEFLSPLDMQVAKRATTVYMTDNVYHMLPKQLCQVCSLLPGQDKLAFSVIWEMTPDAEIVKHRFAKTVIKSCCQMAYEHAQMFIENPKNNWPDDLLNIKGNFTLSDLSEVVNTLQKLAIQMRGKRFADGALRIDQPKLHVVIDRIKGLPISYCIEEQKDSNRLIEEFMLLANMTVATHLYNTIPETALLRNHKEPLKYLLTVTKDIMQKFGVHLDIETAGSLQASIKRYESEFESESEEIKTLVKYRMMVINSLCSKAMARATYKCSSTVKTEEELRHYALNVPLYTHFTSPIRRYADCVVHRLLYSSIQNVSLPENWCKKLCSKIAANCNVKKYSAKVAQEQSSELFFTYLIDLEGPFVTRGIVVDVKEHNVDVILCQIGIKLRVYFAELEKLATIKYSNECSVPTINISWKRPAVTQVINVFTLLHLRVEKHPELFRLVAVPLPPQGEIDLQ